MLGGYGPAKTITEDQRYSPYDLPTGLASGTATVTATAPTIEFGAGPGMVGTSVAAATAPGSGGMYNSDPQSMQGTQQQQLYSTVQTYNTGAQASNAGIGMPGQGEVCQFFQKAGWCRWGDNCRYLHSGGPERQVCQFFQKAGWCRWGDACRHIHIGPAGDAPPGTGMAGMAAAAPVLGQQPVCQFFQKAGWCKFAENCRYLHTGGPPAGTAALPGVAPRGQPEVCQFYQRTGWCKYGDGCRYIHIAVHIAAAGAAAAALGGIGDAQVPSNLSAGLTSVAAVAGLAPAPAAGGLAAAGGGFAGLPAAAPGTGCMAAAGGCSGGFATASAPAPAARGFSGAALGLGAVAPQLPGGAPQLAGAAATVPNGSPLNEALAEFNKALSLVSQGAQAPASAALVPPPLPAAVPPPLPAPPVS